MWAAITYNISIFAISAAVLAYGVFERGWHPAWLLGAIAATLLLGASYKES